MGNEQEDTKYYKYTDTPDKPSTPIKLDTIGAIDPVHYKQHKIEPIDVIEDWGLGFNDGNALKYIGRHKFSGTKRKDLIKAANYLYREATGKWLPRELQE